MSEPANVLIRNSRNGPIVLSTPEMAPILRRAGTVCYKHRSSEITLILMPQAHKYPVLQTMASRLLRSLRMSRVMRDRGNLLERSMVVSMDWRIVKRY